MKNGAYSGLPIFFPEDVAMLASTEDIRDWSVERFGPGDTPIARFYQTLLALGDTVEKGERPTALDPSGILGRHGFVPDGGHWRDLVPLHKPLTPKPARQVA